MQVHAGYTAAKTAAAEMQLWNVGERLGAGARGDQRRPLRRAERHERRQVHRDLALAIFIDDRLPRIAAHQLEIHEAIVAEECRPTERSAINRGIDSNNSSGVL